MRKIIPILTVLCTSSIATYWYTRARNQRLTLDQFEGLLFKQQPRSSSESARIEQELKLLYSKVDAILCRSSSDHNCARAERLISMYRHNSRAFQEPRTLAA
jgi:hypothetical protein